MGNRWTPRKHLMRRFRQLHTVLEDVLNRLEEIKVAHVDHENEKDLCVFLQVMQNRVAELDVLNDAAYNRFKTGEWPEDDDVEPSRLDSQAAQGRGEGSPVGEGEAGHPT